MNDKEIKALLVVLDFVERWNKGDEEKNVAESANILLGLLNGYNEK